MSTKSPGKGNVMSTKTLDRIVALWPELPEAARQSILDIAETHAPHETELELTPEEEGLILQGIDDFEHGRTLTLEEFEARSAAFMETVRKAVAKVP